MATRALLNDLYQLTMAAGYLASGRADDPATFELYFRDHPFRGGYAIAAGLETALDAVLRMQFASDDLRFLASLRSASGAPLYRAEFLDFMEGFRFRGDIRAIPEGTIVFAHEPLVQVAGRLIECQLVETILLCHVNYQTLVATKAARVWEASGHGAIAEFGLRRAQGPDGALSGCRAAYIGGADATSNVLASERFGIPARGTHAHSWVQAFPTEREAFSALAGAFPDDCVLLVDTYDTLESGVPNAIAVGLQLERAGHRLAGIRLDSGDLAELSQRSRAMLDKAGLGYVRIVASNELDELRIAEIVAAGGKIDVWGVGTNLIVAGGEGGGALGGVYKLVEHRGAPKLKRSASPGKTTSPGAKRVVRFSDSSGAMRGDALAAPGETLGTEVAVADPSDPARRFSIAGALRADLLEPSVAAGELVGAPPPLDEIRERRRRDLARLDLRHRRLRDPELYPVGLTAALQRTKDALLAAIGSRKAD